MCSEISKFFNSTERPYVLPICEGTALLVKKASFAVGSMFEAVDWIDREISIVAEPYVSPSVAAVSRAFVRAIPYMGISYIFPRSFAWPLYGGIFVYSVFITPMSGMSTISDVGNAVAFTAAFSGTRDIKNGIQERSVLKTGCGIVKTACAGYFLYRQFC